MNKQKRTFVILAIIQPNIEKEQQTPKIQYFRGFLMFWIYKELV